MELLSVKTEEVALTYGRLLQRVLEDTDTAGIVEEAITIGDVEAVVRTSSVIVPADVPPERQKGNAIKFTCRPGLVAMYSSVMRPEPPSMSQLVKLHDAGIGFSSIATTAPRANCGSKRARSVPVRSFFMKELYQKTTGRTSGFCKGLRPCV